MELRQEDKPWKLQAKGLENGFDGKLEEMAYRGIRAVGGG